MMHFSILYRGNAMDGWFSSFIAFTALRKYGTIRIYARRAHDIIQDKEFALFQNKHVLFLDMTPDVESLRKMERVAKSVCVIDDRDSVLPSMAEQVAAAAVSSEAVQEKACTAVRVWRNYYPELALPHWLESMDRVVRWDAPTMEDRCLRPLMMKIAQCASQQSVEESLRATDRFMRHMNEITLFPGVRDGFYAAARAVLEREYERMQSILSKGYLFLIGKEERTRWDLSEAWEGVTIFVLDNSDVLIDTTEAAQQVFDQCAQVEVFVNYRKKVRRVFKTGVLEDAMIYSARSRTFDLTQDGVFQGQPHSAGTMRFVSSEKCPFLLPPVLSRKQKAAEAAAAANELTESLEMMMIEEKEQEKEA